MQLVAVCLLLLDAPERGKPSGSSVVEIKGGVVLAREMVVAVREVDRRVLRVHVPEEVGEVVLITCVGRWVCHSAR